MLYICNSFSLSMLDSWRLEDSDSITMISIQPVDNPLVWLEEAEARHGTAVSAVGHNDTAELFSSLLSRDIRYNRTDVKLDESTELLIGQIIGPRPPEGRIVLSPGVIIKWLAVTLL